MGTIMNSPGPLNDWNFPKRRTTAFSHWSAIFIADEIIIARRKVIAPIIKVPVPARLELTE